MNKTKTVVLTCTLLLDMVLIAGLFDVYPLDMLPSPVLEKRLLEERVRSFEIIRDSFLYTKALSGHFSIYMKEEYGWALLHEIEENHDLTVKLYNSRGEHAVGPDRVIRDDNPVVRSVLSSKKEEVSYDKEEKLLYAALPIYTQQDCLVCHRDQKDGELYGVMTFSVKTDYSPLLLPEKKVVCIMLIVLVTMVGLILLNVNPLRRIHKLFDN